MAFRGSTSFYVLVCMVAISANGGVWMSEGCATQCGAFYTACAYQALLDGHPVDCCGTGIDCSLYTCPGTDCTNRLVPDLANACSACMTSTGVNDQAACTLGGVAAVDCLLP